MLYPPLDVLATALAPFAAIDSAVFPSPLERLLQLIATLPAAQLCQIVGEAQLDIHLIESLKAHSADFYFSHPAKAVEIGEQALKLSHCFPSPALALGRWTLANALVVADRYLEAIDLFALARAEYLEIGQPDAAARLSVGYVFAAAFSGQVASAMRLAAETEPILLTLSETDPADAQRLGKLLMNVGAIHELQGEYEEALSVYERQEQIARRLQDGLMLAQLKHNQAFALTRLNSFADALQLFGEAEALFLQENEVETDLVRLYTNQALLLAAIHRYTEAKEVVGRARSLASKIEGSELLRHWNTLIAARIDLQHESELPSAVEEALHTAQIAFAQAGLIEQEGDAWSLLGQCYRHRQAWPQAEAAFGQAYRLATACADQTIEQQAHVGRAQVAQQQGDLPSARHFYESAIESIELTRQALRVELLRADFLSNKLTIYQDLAHLYLQQQQPEQAFTTIERSKARLLADKLAARLAMETIQLTQSEDAQIRDLSLALQSVLQQLAESYQRQRFRQAQSELANPGVTDPQTAPTIHLLERQAQDLIRKIQRQQPLFSPLTTGELTPLAQVQAQLGDQILLYYHQLQDEICVFVISQQGIERHLHLATQAEVAASQRSLAANIDRTLQMCVQLGLDKALRFLAQLLQEANRHLQRLYQLLLAPLLIDLPATAPLVIVPDGVLHYLPFHAFYDGTRYLIEQRSVSYTPSATLFSLCLQPTTPTARMLLCGYDDGRLHSVAHEMTALASFLPAAEQLIAQAATTKHFLQAAPQKQIIHLSAHAKFRSDAPMLSSIQLADRALTLAEVAQLTLDAELVALSGCETGYGQLHGADLLSLAGGFLGAGARSLLVSLWRVEDQAATQLMLQFYQQLLAGEGRSVALQTTQCALLQLGRKSATPQAIYQHPAFWSPFILIGNPNRLAARKQAD